MQTVSAVAQEVLSGQGGMVVPVVEAWQAGQRKASLAVTGMSTTMDATAAVPRTCTVTLAGFESLIPDVGALPAAGTYADTTGTYGDGVYGDPINRYLRGLVIPGVTELRLWDRLTLPDGSTEDLPAGVYRVDTVAFRHSSKGVQATITGVDAADRIAAAGYTAPHLIPHGTTVGGALGNLLQLVAPGVQHTVPGPSNYTTPRMAFLPVSGANPWEDARRIAYSAGWELTTDRDGGVVAFSPGDPGTGTAVWHLTEARLVDVATKLDDSTAVNTVVIDGQTAEDLPVRGVAEMVTGQWGVNSIGRRTHYETREQVNTQAQANMYAHAVLRQLAGLPDTLTLRVPFLPHLDAWDLVDTTDTTLQLDATTYRVVRATTDRASMETTLDVARRLA